MFDTEFWGEPISIYTDADALEDGGLTDISNVRVAFNGKIINRAALEASILIGVEKEDPQTLRETLQFISVNAKFDGEGADAWGIFQNQLSFDNQKLWLVPNEVRGYTLMLPSEY